MLLKPSGASSVTPCAHRVRARVRRRLRGSCGTVFMEDGRHRRARVLDIHVEVAGSKRAIADERAAEIQLANDRHAAFGFDRLRDSSPRTTCSVKFFDPTTTVARRCARRRRRQQQRGRSEATAAGTRARRAEMPSRRRSGAPATPARHRPPAPAPRPGRRRPGSSSYRPSTVRGRCIRRGRPPRSPRRSWPCRRRSRWRRGCRR